MWRDHTDLLQTRSAQILKDLAKLAEDGFTKAQEEYEKSVAAWGASSLSLSLPR